MLNLLSLESRLVPATTAILNAGLLSVVGDAADNQIVVSADLNNNVQVTDNGVLVPIQVVSGSLQKSMVSLISVQGQAGNDSIILDRSLNTRDAQNLLIQSPTAYLDGGSGHDSIQPLIGGFLNGIIGNPVIGNTVMVGGSGNDILTSGFGNDVMLGGDGNDQLIWLPGTLNDVYEGGKGLDNAVVVGNGNNQADAFLLQAHPTSPGRVLFQRTNLVPFSIDIDDCEVVTLKPQSGDDSVQILSLLGTDVRQVRVEGDLGNDQIDATGLGKQVSAQLIGGDGNDSIRSGAGNDILDGGAGNDLLLGGAGSDLLLGGDGNDVLISNDDKDRDLLFGGAGADMFIADRKDRILDWTSDDFLL